MMVAGTAAEVKFMSQVVVTSMTICTLQHIQMQTQFQSIDLHFLSLGLIRASTDNNWEATYTKR